MATGVLHCRRVHGAGVGQVSTPSTCDLKSKVLSEPPSPLIQESSSGDHIPLTHEATPTLLLSHMAIPLIFAVRLPYHVHVNQWQSMHLAGSLLVAPQRLNFL